MRQLRPSDHGKYFNALIHNSPIAGKISYDGKYFYLCQNSKDGAYTGNKLGYLYSWTVHQGTIDEIQRCDVFNLYIIEDIDIENYKEFSIGDTVVKDEIIFKIIDQFNDKLFIQNPLTNIVIIKPATILFEEGYRLYIEKEEEVKVETASIPVEKFFDEDDYEEEEEEYEEEIEPERGDLY